MDKKDKIISFASGLTVVSGLVLFLVYLSGRKASGSVDAFDLAVINTIKQALPIFTVIAQVFVILLLVLKFVPSLPQRGKLLKLIGKNSIFLALIVALTSVLGSLFYSEVLGYEPCKLCWYQRILMYPQPLLLAAALWKEDKRISDYILSLSILGMLVSGYHYLLQRGIMPQVPCSVVGFSVGCSEKFFMTFGYITIPLMAFTAFALISLLMLFSKELDS